MRNGTDWGEAFNAASKTIMKTENTENKLQPTPEKRGFFTRILNKVDTSMKAKADEAAKNECCSGDKKGKGGKCC
jgi:hypothetical protein